MQVVSVHVRASSSRPPKANCDAFVDVATRATVVARTEKVEKTFLAYKLTLVVFLWSVIY